MRENKLQVEVYHNILWSKYKGVVFSSLSNLSQASNLDFKFFQIAETERDRISLGGVDLNYHKYKYELLFNGAYDDIPKYKLVTKLATNIIKSNATLILLPGYHKIEYWGMLIASILSGKKRAVFCDSTIHDRPHSIYKNIAKRIFFSLCNGFFGYGTRSKDYLVSLGAKENLIYYRCQAAALPFDYKSSDALEAKIKNLHSSTKNHFIYVGRLSIEKDIPTLLLAIKKLKPIFSGIKLEIIGNGPTKKELQDLIIKENLSNNVFLCGSMDVKDLSKKYSEATAMILPSTSEPWGLVVNEALSYGCPSIVSDHCGCVPELIIDGKTGYTFKTGDHNDLADKISLTIKSLCNEETAINCITHIEKFSPKNAATQIIKGCEKIIK